MATYLQGVSDTNLQTPLFQPNYSFLQANMEKKETQYLKGLSEVSAGYNAIVNSTVTGDEMNKRKQEYIQSADEGLKKISASDLSLPTNSSQAQNLYAPFWQDDLMVKNIGLTKSSHSEIAKAYSWRDSKDEGLRSQFNDYTVMDIQQGLKELAEAPLTKEAYSKLEMRRATPVYDITADVGKEIKELGDKGQITTVDASGAVLRITGGGPQSVPGYNAYYRSVAERPKYAPQIKMIGRVLANTKMEEIKKYNEMNGLPTSTEYIKANFGQYVSENLQKNYTEGIANYREKARETRLLNDKIIPVDKDGNPTNPDLIMTPEQQAQWNINTQQANYWDKLATNLENRAAEQMGYDPSTGQIDLRTPAYQNFIRNISTSPADYYGDVYIKEQADYWANGRASVTSEDIKANEAWEALTEESHKLWKERFDAAKFKVESAQKDRVISDKEWVNWQKYGVTPDGMTPADMGNYSGAGAPSKGGVNIGSGAVSGYTQVDVYKEEHPLDKFQSIQEAKIANINRTTFDFNGLSRVLSSEYIDGGMDMNAIMKFSENMQQSLSSNRYNRNPEYEGASQQVNAILDKYGLGQYKGGPSAYRQGINELAAKVAKDLVTSADPAKQQQGMTLYRQYQAIRDDMSTFQSNQEKFKTAVAQEIAGKPAYKILYNKETGLPYTASDMAPDFPELTLVDEAGHKRAMTAEEYAQNYRSNNLKSPIDLAGGTGRPYFFDMDGHRYYVQSMNKNGKSPNDFTEVKEWSKGIVDKYGYMGAQDELQRKVGNKILESMHMTPDGLTGKILSYDISTKGKEGDETQKNTGIELGRRILIPGNHQGIYYRDDDGALQKLPEDERKALLALDSWDGLTTNVSKIEYSNVGPNGVPSVKFKMQMGKDSEKDNQQSDVDLTKLLKRGEIIVDRNIKNADPFLNQLPQRTEMFKYDKLFKGESIQAEEFDKSAGFDYNMVPDPTSKDASGRITSVNLSYRSWQIDERTGLPLYEKDGVTPKWQPVQYRQVNLMNGPNAKSPDELVYELYGFINNEFAKRINLRKLYMDNQTPKEGDITVGEFIKRYK